MLKLSERKNMQKRFDLYDALEVLGVSVMIFLSLVLSNYSILVGLCIPIGVSIFCLIQADKRKIIAVIIIAFILSYIDSQDKYIMVSLFLVSLISLVLSLEIGFNLNDIDAIIILFVINSIVFNLFYFYIIKDNSIDFNQMSNEVYNMFSKEGYSVSKEMIKATFDRIPSVISIFSLIYSVISYKLVRNFLNYKNKDIRDMQKLNTIKLSVRELIIFIVLSLLVALIFIYLNYDLNLIRENIFSILIAILQINGLLTMDYTLELRSSNMYRAMSWIFVVLLFSFLNYFFLILGIVDSIFDLRAKMGAIDERKY